jgi:hypothetical protein
MKLLTSLLVSFFALTLSSLAQANPHTVTLAFGWTLGTGGAADHFNVKRSTTTGGPYSTIGTVAIPPSNPPATFGYVDTSAVGNVLVEGTIYYYVITAADTANLTESANSNEAPAKIPFNAVSPPTQLSAVAK